MFHNLISRPVLPLEKYSHGESTSYRNTTSAQGHFGRSLAHNNVLELNILLSPFQTKPSYSSVPHRILCGCTWDYGAHIP